MVEDVNKQNPNEELWDESWVGPDDAWDETWNEQGPTEAPYDTWDETWNEQGPTEALDDAWDETWNEQGPTEALEDAWDETWNEQGPTEALDDATWDEKGPTEALEDAWDETWDEKGPTEALEDAWDETWDEQGPTEALVAVGGETPPWEAWEETWGDDVDDEKPQTGEALKNLMEDPDSYEEALLQLVDPDYRNEILQLDYPLEVEKIYDEEFLDIEKLQAKRKLYADLGKDKLDEYMQQCVVCPYFISWHYYMARLHYRDYIMEPYKFGMHDVIDELCGFGLWCFAHSLVHPLEGELNYKALPKYDHIWLTDEFIMAEAIRARWHPDFPEFMLWYHRKNNLTTIYDWGADDNDLVADMKAYAEWLVETGMGAWDESCESDPEIEKILRMPTLELGGEIPEDTYAAEGLKDHSFVAVEI